jgi:hypothetical protein
MTIVRAAILYFAVVFAAGFIAGTFRTLIVAPRLGEVAAVALELPVMIAVSWWACGWVLRRWPVTKDVAQRLAMGLVALVLLLVGEAAISLLLGGLTLQQHVALYAAAPAQLGLVAQVIFAILPILAR